MQGGVVLYKMSLMRAKWLQKHVILQWPVFFLSIMGWSEIHLYINLHLCVETVFYLPASSLLFIPYKIVRNRKLYLQYQAATVREPPFYIYISNIARHSSRKRTKMIKVCRYNMLHNGLTRSLRHFIRTYDAIPGRMAKVFQ